jgi:hypothetical protein
LLELLEVKPLPLLKRNLRVMRSIGTENIELQAASLATVNTFSTEQSNQPPT